MMEKTGRRAFLAQMGGAMAAGAALLAAQGCEIAGLATDDDFGMHGPIRINHEILQLPANMSARRLLAPYEDGAPFMDRWAIAHVVRGKRDQMVVLLVDTETGGHAELEVFARDLTMHPIAYTEHYGIYVDNDGRGDVQTPRPLRKLSERLADIIRQNEAGAELDWQLPTMSQAAKVQYPQLHGGEDEGEAEESWDCQPG